MDKTDDKLIKSGKKKILQADRLDFCYKMYLLYGGIHYALDVLVKAHAYGFGIYRQPCKLWYFLHHI